MIFSIFVSTLLVIYLLWNGDRHHNMLAKEKENFNNRQRDTRNKLDSIPDYIS